MPAIRVEDDGDDQEDIRDEDWDGVVEEDHVDSEDDDEEEKYKLQPTRTTVQVNYSDIQTWNTNQQEKTPATLMTSSGDGDEQDNSVRWSLSSQWETCA